jgi:hypothetical protein
MLQLTEELIEEVSHKSDFIVLFYQILKFFFIFIVKCKIFVYYVPPLYDN